MRRLAIHLTLLTALLSGCAATSYEMVRIDSRMPLILNTTGTTIKPCADKGGQLENVGESCLALVRADRLVSFSTLNVGENECYQFEFPDNQAWYDATRRNADANGEKGSGIMNLAAGLKRNPSDLWFFLSPVVLDGELDQAAAVKRLSEPKCAGTDGCKQGGKWSNFGTNHYNFQSILFSTGKAKGRLAFYPNDAMPPEYSTIYYKNNTGQVWIVVHRTRNDRCT